MNNLFEFEAERFGVSQKALHLLRNRFNYKTINFEEIDSIVIRRGKDLKNWIWVLIVGLALLSYSIFDLFKLYIFFSDDTPGVYQFYIERLLIPIFPMLLGIYSVIISFRTTLIMVVQDRETRYYLSLRQLIKSNKIQDFKVWIKNTYPLTLVNE